MMGELSSTEDALNSVIETALAHSDKKHAGLIRKAESNWENYVESECDAEGDTSRDGTAYAEIFTICERDHYRERVEEMKKDYNLDGVYGDGSGD